MKQAVFLLLVIGYAKAHITCRGLNGEPVDWFVVYKPPTSSRSPSQFYYADGDRSNWTLGPLPITATTTAVGATLGEFYESNKKNFIFAYNDDSPTGKVDSYRGHSKGVTVFDEDTGFWLIHSVPNFPSLGSYSYPATGIKFGQTFLCLSLPTRFLGDVGEHLRYLQATPFFYNLPNQFSESIFSTMPINLYERIESLGTIPRICGQYLTQGGLWSDESFDRRLPYPVLVNIVKKQSIPKSTTHFTRVAQLSTIRGMPLRSFSKHKKFNKDLWFDLVGPELGTNLAVESWLNGGADDLESICTRGISIYDVSVVGLPDISFNSSRDHSKWAVADTNGRTSIVCVGDLNRQKSQFGRGGGAVCFQHHGLWTTFHNSVKSVQPCGRKNIHSYLNYVLPTVLSIVVLSTLRFTVP